MLFLSNMIPWSNNFTSECMIWSWYISVDIHLFILSAPIFALWAKNRKAAIIAMLVLIIGGTISVLALSYQYNLAYFGTSYDTWDILYTKPWLRFAPYFIGVAAGIYFSLEKPILTGFWWRPVFYLVSAVLILLPVFGTYTYFHDTWSTGTNAFYLALSRPSFVIGLSLLSYCMMHGYAAPLRAFLAAEIWGPLSRLTFSSYLLHPVFIYIMFINTESVEMWTPLSIAFYYTSFVFFSYVSALIVWLLVEKPFMNMEKFWMPPRAHEKKEKKDEPESEKLLVDDKRL